MLDRTSLQLGRAMEFALGLPPGGLQMEDVHFHTVRLGTRANQWNLDLWESLPESLTSTHWCHPRLVKPYIAQRLQALDRANTPLGWEFRQLRGGTRVPERPVREDPPTWDYVDLSYPVPAVPVPGHRYGLPPGYVHIALMGGLHRCCKALWTGADRLLLTVLTPEQERRIRIQGDLCDDGPPVDDPTLWGYLQANLVRIPYENFGPNLPFPRDARTG